MSLQLQATQNPVAQNSTTQNLSDFHWKHPAAGVWVASRRGDYAGMVERHSGSYHAMNGRGRALGSFDDFDEARRVIDGGAETGSSFRDVKVATAVLWGIIGGAASVAIVLAVALIRAGG